MSIAGGIDRAIDRAEAVEATALQLFVKSARQWSSRALGREEVTRFRSRLAASGLERHTLAHASYLINLAAPERAVREHSVSALRQELRRCARLGVPYLVLHPGSHVGDGEERGLRRVARAVDRVLGREAGSRAVDPPMLLLEVTAGQGSNLGARFEHLAWILDAVRNGDRLGVCFDTCHALAAGYEFRDRDTYRETFAEFDRVIGLSRLRAFHLNDSKFPLGSRKDRHEHIGRGELGLEPFRLLLRDARFRELPMVLETPKGPDLKEDRENLAVLRAMCRGRRR